MYGSGSGSCPVIDSDIIGSGEHSVLLPDLIVRWNPGKKVVGMGGGQT